MTFRTARLSEICDINPKMPKSLDDSALASFLPMAAVSEEGRIAFEEERTVTEVKKGYTYFERGDVLVAKITPCFENGKASRTNSLSKPFGFGSTEFHVLRAAKDVVPDFLFYKIWNSSFRELGAQNMTGSAGQKRVPADFLKSLEIRLPQLDEQRRIVAILDKADVLRRKREQALGLLDSLTQSIFLEMFGSHPSGCSHQLSDLVESPDRINYGVVQPGEDDPHGTYLVRVSDLRNGRVNHSNLRKVSKQISAKHGRSILKGNEILISCVGSIGEIAITSDAEIGFNIARAVARVPLNDKILRIYVAEYLRSPNVQRYFTKELRTVSQPTLNIKQISETQIAIPSESELKEFHHRVRSVSDGLGLARSQASHFDFLFTSLQSRAFSGQL